MNPYAPLYGIAQRLRLVYWRLFHPEIYGAKGLIFDREGRLLLIRHSYGRSDLYMLPGGGMKRGEAPDEAFRREAMEEVGCTVREIRLCGLFLDTTHGARNHVHLIEAHTDDRPTIDGREIVEARFFALDALPDNVSNATLRRIDDWRTGRSEGAW